MTFYDRLSEIELQKLTIIHTIMNTTKSFKFSQLCLMLQEYNVTDKPLISDVLGHLYERGLIDIVTMEDESRGFRKRIA